MYNIYLFTNNASSFYCSCKASILYIIIKLQEQHKCYTKHMNPKLVVEQKITAFVNKYSVFNANPDGRKGQLVALAQQKRLAFKEKVTFYSDETKTKETFSFRAEKTFDIHGRYFVEDPQGQRVGVFGKIFGKSLLVSSWNIFNAQDQVVMTVAESNVLLAVLRRFLGYIPYIGDFLSLIILLFKYHFTFTDAQGRLVGKYQKTTLFRDHYLLSMTDEAYASEDWRTYAALAVGLDALQSR